MADLRGYVEGMIGFEGGSGTNVVANPTGTPTDNLETVQIGETIYNVGGGGEEIVPTPTNVDRGKYLGVKSNANELEYRSINELPSSEGVSAGTVLTHTISGDSWLPPEQELPTYTTGDNGKVLGVSSGALAWIEQSGGGGVSYSTDEQDTGLTWIDGSHIYQKTYVLSSPISLSERNEVTVDLGSSGTNINLIIDAQVYRMTASQYGPCVAYMMVRKAPNSSNIMIYSYVNVSDINIITLRYTKSSS